MNRLFLKILFWLWFSLMLTALIVGLAVRWQERQSQSDLSELADGPRADIAVSVAAATLRHGGVEALKEVLRERPLRRARVLVVDALGNDALGRVVPRSALKLARARLKDDSDWRAARRVQTADGESYILFIARPANRPLHHVRPGHPPAPEAPPRGRLLVWVSVLGSLLFSVTLAWYLSRPVRHLRQATESLANGDLSTRVASSISRRRDELGDLAQDFNHMARRLQVSVEAQRRLLHDVSHELRSPLARLAVAVELARQPQGDLAPLLDRIEHESQRLNELLGQVLTLSRIDTAGQQTAHETIDLSALLGNLVDDARFEASAKQIEIRTTWPDAAKTPGDGELLHRAFENVLRNAIRYSPHGGAITVELQPDGDQWRISVNDRGPGLNGLDPRTLFDPFVRGAQSRGEGHGLGLAIARSAVEHCGGTIRAEQRPPSGLSIIVNLPMG